MSLTTTQKEDLKKKDELELLIEIIDRLESIMEELAYFNKNNDKTVNNDENS